MTAPLTTLRQRAKDQIAHNEAAIERAGRASRWIAISAVVSEFRVSLALEGIRKTAAMNALRHARQQRRIRRKLRRLFNRPPVWEVEAANATPAEPKRYRADDLAEYLLSERGRESMGLVLLAAGSIGLIWVLHHA